MMLDAPQKRDQPVTAERLLRRHAALGSSRNIGYDGSTYQNIAFICEPMLS